MSDTNQVEKGLEMGMLFCRSCGKEIDDSLPSCPHCGAVQRAVSPAVEPAPTKVSVPVEDIPDGIRGWSWGAFLLTWIWAIGNRTWIGLLTLIPYVGFIMAIVLGIRGREWAWKNKKWDSVEHFNRVQRLWSMWAIGLVLGSLLVIGIVAVKYPWALDSSLGMDDPAEVQVAEPATEAELNEEVNRILADAKLENSETASASEQAVSGFAPSFDCSTAANDVERLICGNRELSAADVRLAQAFQMAQVRNIDRRNLKEEQDDWRRTERDVCTTHACILEAYEQRYLDISGN